MEPSGIVVSVQDMNGQQAVSSRQAPAHTSAPRLTHPRKTTNTSTIQSLTERDEELDSGTCKDASSFGDVDTPEPDEGDADLFPSKRRVTLTMDDDGQLEISSESPRECEEPQAKVRFMLDVKLAFKCLVLPLHVCLTMN